MNDRVRFRTTIPGLITIVTLSAAVDVGRASLDEASHQERPAPAARMAATLDSARSAPGPKIWPGYRPSEQILIVVHGEEELTAVAGDPRPPAGFRPTAYDGIHVRAGPVPDTLSTLKLAADWNGRSGIATLVPWRDSGMLETLLHESFHTFQINTRRSQGELFPTAGTPNFPASDTTALEQLAVEGELLARALEAKPGRARVGATRAALAARRIRCGHVGTAECEAERRIELYEGTASYVAGRLVRKARGRSGSAARERGSLSERLRSTGLLDATGRFSFYWTGEAWLTLLAGLREGRWQNLAARRAPDRLVEQRVGTAPEPKSTPAAVLAMASTRVREALEARERRAADRDTAHRRVAGVRIQVNIRSDARVSMSGHALSDGRVKLRTVASDGTYIVDMIARRRRLPSGASEYAVSAQRLCWRISGRQMCSDDVGAQGEGTLELRTEEATIEAERATVDVRRNRIVVEILSEEKDPSDEGSRRS